ncbi:MAG: preprotein translocase subunit SecA [SAR324 cluster bacterium]|nr:preprotein translocase subunit SecA [SAR324 cluster bacterium]MED5240714.1 preprotein translocase subunit SecA [SAR324 cluster bacterium]MED5516838.1 preprotein translocase subunit SecA [SAR324 cluster bacterium]
MWEKVKNILGNENLKTLKSYQKVVSKINALEAETKALDDGDFPLKTADFQAKLKADKGLDDLIPEAFALVREASRRVIGERHYDVQLLGGLALHHGNIAEMATGEGKTLSSTCPVYLNALDGKGVHIITPNDYLAKRDSQWMGQIFKFLGLKVGLIQHGIYDEERRNAYAADITYGTNNEFGFDYLRDNMKYSLEDYVQRDFNFAVVDEVDSILIDEARTPLIISGPTEDNIDKYHQINKFVYGLSREIRKEEVGKLPQDQMHNISDNLEELEDHDIVRDGDFALDERARSINLTDQGSVKIEERLQDMLVKDTSLFDYDNMEILHHVNQALKAHYMFNKDVDYVVQEGQVIIVDEFTGRLMPGRRFSDGLHQALEAKEGVTIERENQTLATITFQNYFRLYSKLSGMTGTAETEKNEFKKIYNLGVVVVPTNKPLARKDLSDVVFKTVDAKYRATVDRISELNQKGQPVLVGTVSIEVSESISKLLKKEGIAHEVLNAKHHEREAEIISAAGQFGAVTIATNMAGRGTDIKPSQETLEVGGLFVLGTGRHDSRRIDNQFRGRSGRQGDPGASQFLLSLEDDLLRIFGGERISNLMDKLNIEEDEPIEHVFITKAIGNAQRKVEGYHFDMRKHVLEYDDVMEKQRSIIYGRRREILGEGVQNLILEMCDGVVDRIMNQHCADKYADQWDVKGFNRAFESVFGKVPNEKWYEEELKADEHAEIFYKWIEDLYKEKIDFFRKVAAFNFEPEVSEDDGKDLFIKMILDLERQVLLKVNDNLWKDHLLSMDHLREGIGLVGYAQKKPLDEYRKQAFEMFSDLMDRIDQEAISTFYKLTIAHHLAESEPTPLPQDVEFIHGEVEKPTDEKVKQKKQQPVRAQATTGRNEPCPCGSGKKYKKCCGIAKKIA